MPVSFFSLVHVLSTDVCKKRIINKTPSKYAIFQMCKLHKVYSPAILTRPRSGQVHWRGQSVFDERYRLKFGGFLYGILQPPM